jgi:hypothetical protein
VVPFRVLIIGASAGVQQASQRPKYLILAFNSGLTRTDAAAARLARNGDLAVSGYATLASLKVAGNHLLALHLRSQHFCRPTHQPQINWPVQEWMTASFSGVTVHVVFQLARGNA